MNIKLSEVKYIECVEWCTRAVQEVSSHFEYLHNRSRGSQSEETLLCIREQSLSRGARQSAVRCRWLSLCTVWQLSCRLFGKASHHPCLSAPSTAQIWLHTTSGFSQS